MLIRSAGDLVHAHTLPILRVLLHRLRVARSSAAGHRAGAGVGPYARGSAHHHGAGVAAAAGAQVSDDVSVAVLATLGELAAVGGRDLLPHLRTHILPPVVAILIREPTSSAARLEVALRTLEQLVRHTGYAGQC